MLKASDIIYVFIAFSYLNEWDEDLCPSLEHVRRKGEIIKKRLIWEPRTKCKRTHKIRKNAKVKSENASYCQYHIL